MAIVLQHTSPTLGDIFVHNDDSVTNVADGSPNTTAAVSHYEENGIDIIRVDLNDNGMLDVNPVPQLMDVRIVREEGWQSNLGYRCILEDFKDGMDTGVLALAVYDQPGGIDYQYTTGAFVWMADYERYGAVCPPGFEPGQEDIHFGMLYGATPYSTFTMHSQWNEQTFSCGGGDTDIPPPPDEWIDSGETVVGLVGAAIIRVTDTTPFPAGTNIKINDIETTVSYIHTPGANGIIVLGVHIAVSGGEIIYTGN